ncbi:response regulator transcription factor [Mangrovimonas xylaniphaga]|uniref:response regulator transcription factor n=1 Tax=Mangrovimonas xylaniphaga TaxID=1645915 RepID=UPI0006B61A20|nr:response regulator transcription factor [Mangrovimonas xylaniphaga]
MEEIRIILVDDHVLVRDGIKALLENEQEFLVIDEASNGVEALEILKETQPDLLIVDIRMPVMNGIEVVNEVNSTYPHLKTLILSMHDSEEYVLNSIAAGADGYLLKGSSKEEFLKALHTVASGGKYFTGDVSSIIINNMMGATVAQSKKESSQKELPFKLTKREKQILSIVLQGKSNKEVAKELEVSKRTAEVHRYNLMKKLDVKNLIELSKMAEEYNLI